MAKRQQKSRSAHGDVSYRHMQGKPTRPQDHPATDIPDPYGGLFQGKQLGTSPTPQPAATDLMSGAPAMYPGQELGA
jgi:hypothetical protein